MQAARLSVSVPLALAETVRKRAGTRGLSGFVARALENELERERLGAYLAELDSKVGPVSDDALDAARCAWHKR